MANQIGSSEGGIGREEGEIGRESILYFVNQMQMLSVSFSFCLFVYGKNEKKFRGIEKKKKGGGLYHDDVRLCWRQ